MALVMGVQAGFGGQSFQPAILERLEQLRRRLPAETLLEVDGGINAETIAACAHRGAQLFVVGSAIFRQAEYRPVVERLAGLATV